MKYYSDSTWTPYVDSVQVVYSGPNQKVYLPERPRGSVLEIKTIGIFAPSLAANRSTMFFMESHGTKIASNSLLVNSGIGRLHQIFTIIPSYWKFGIEIISADADERFYISATGKLYFPTHILNGMTKV